VSRAVARCRSYTIRVAWKAEQVRDGVEVRCESRWWGNQYNVVGESDFPVPEKLILFVSQRGMDHGFWRDLRVGDATFDAQFFVFCDSPALLPIICGEATRAALSNTGPHRNDITLYVRHGRVKTTGIAKKDDEEAVDRHVAIHRSLVEDHRGFLASWKARLDTAAGRGDAVWPPAGTLLRPAGALLVKLAWTAPTSRDASDWDEAADSMRTLITAHDDRARMKWTLREVSPTTPCTHVLAGRRFTLVGALPFALPLLDNIIRQGQLASIAVHEKTITVGVHGIASARQVEGAVRVIHLVVEATTDASSPYR
jgi:hypothetical protein